MKRRKTLMVILLLLLLTPVVLLLFNRLRAKNLNDQYPALGEPIQSRELVLKELSVPGRTIAMQAVDRTQRDPLQETDDIEYIRYDKNTQQVIILSDEYVSNVPDGTGSGTRVHISYFTLDGELTDHHSGIYRVNDDLKGTILLKDHIAIYQKWKDDKRHIYLRHFGIEDMWPSCLNPFTLGGINGSAPCHVWSGSGYFELYVDGDTLRFRSPAEKGELFFTEHNTYSTNLRYYKLPSALNKPTPAFLLYTPSEGKHRAFIIKKR